VDRNECLSERGRVEEGARSTNGPAVRLSQVDVVVDRGVGVEAQRRDEQQAEDEAGEGRDNAGRTDDRRPAPGGQIRSDAQ
jgi:hypothetical protein